MDKNRIEKLITLHCLMGIVHEAGSTIVDGAHLRDWTETEMLLDSFHEELVRYVRRLTGDCR